MSEGKNEFDPETVERFRRHTEVMKLYEEMTAMRGIIDAYLARDEGDIEKMPPSAREEALKYGVTSLADAKIRKWELARAIYKAEGNVPDGLSPAEAQALVRDDRKFTDES